MSWSPVTLAEVLRFLPHEVAVDFTCPDRGPHPWTSATIPHVLNQHCPLCGAKKPIPGARLRPEGRGWWLY